MADILTFPARRPSQGVSVSYQTIKEFDGTDDCQRIVLCRGKSHQPEVGDSYAVLFMAPPGSVDSFDIIAEFKHTELGLNMAKMIAEAADRVLSCVHMLQPDDEEDWTPEQVDELCAEARATFGDRAAEQLRAKLTGTA